MKFKQSAAKITLIGAMSIAAAGFGTGLAHADPPFPTPPPWPVPAPDDRPGINASAPGNPLPPGQSYLPPPGHSGPTPQDAVVPLWAPPAPPSPSWAPLLPVIWNTELNAWGVWWNGSFQTL
jgi:hypothetical protein